MSSGQKLVQLEETIKGTAAVETVLIGVVDTHPVVALNAHDDFLQAARLAWETVGRNDMIHVAVVTGRETLGYGRDDCVFPSWIGD